MAGLNVTLVDKSGHKCVDKAVTGEDGSFLFKNLPPGEYGVQFPELPPDFLFTLVPEKLQLGGKRLTCSMCPNWLSLLHYTLMHHLHVSNTVA